VKIENLNKKKKKRQLNNKQINSLNASSANKDKLRDTFLVP